MTPAAWLLVALSAEPRLLVHGTVRAGDGDAALDSARASDALEQQAELLLALALYPRAEWFGSALEHGLRGCGADAPCITRELERGGVRFALVFAANLSTQPPLATLSLLEAGRREALSQRIFPVPAGEGSALARLREEAARLYADARLPLGGRLVLELEPADALVQVDGSPALAARTGLRLPPGPHQLRVWRDGFRELRPSVELRAGEDNRMHVRLEEDGGVLDSPWFWGALGLAVAAGAGAAVLLLRPDPPLYLCQQRDPALPCP